ncbi:MAG: penicillin acylase family protein, partial [Bacteroidota bacterium]
PGVLIGFNEATAWGITNVGHDVLDWYRIQWTDDTRTTYRLDGKAVEPEWVTDTIWVNGQAEPEIVRTPWTVFGPVVYDQPESGYRDLAMRWLAHDPPRLPDTDQIEVFLSLMRNTGLETYREALRGFAIPASNIVYANQAGDVALTVTGQFPLRQRGQGRLVQNGTKSEALWPGFVPFDHIPRSVNPERQFVASANQRSTDTDYPYYYYGGFADYRGRYLNRRLDSMQNVRPEDFMALQHDAHNLLAEEALPQMLDLLKQAELPAHLASRLEQLRNWDYRHTSESIEPVFFQMWYDSLYRYTFDEVYALQQEERPLLYPENWRLIELLETARQDPIFDDQSTSERETALEMVHQAFMASSQAADLLLETDGYDWNTHRGSSIPHLARIPGMGRSSLQTDGWKYAPNALSATFGPSWRMVVSLEDPIRAWGVLPGGSSGNPGSPWYDYGIDEWSKGEYFELYLYPEAAAVPNPYQQLVFDNTTRQK